RSDSCDGDCRPGLRSIARAHEPDGCNKAIAEDEDMGAGTRSMAWLPVRSPIQLASVMIFACVASWVPTFGEDRASSRPKLMVQLGHSGPILCSAVSPDETMLLTGGQDYTARLWDLETGKELRRFLAHREPVDLVMFSPDGS